MLAVDGNVFAVQPTVWTTATGLGRSSTGVQAIAMLLVTTNSVLHHVACKPLLQHTFVYISSVKYRGDLQTCCTALSRIVLLVNSEYTVLIEPCILYILWSLCVLIAHKLLRDKSVF